jgi:hypothetical protein
MKVIVVYYHGEPWQIFKDFAGAVDYINSQQRLGFEAVEQRVEHSEYRADMVCIEGYETYNAASHYFEYQDWMDEENTNNLSEGQSLTNIID